MYHTTKFFLWLPHALLLGAMLSVRLDLEAPAEKPRWTATVVLRASGWHRRCFPQIGMNLNTRLQKLREQKKLVVEALRQAEFKASTCLRKRQTRAKIILGGALLSLPESEREVLFTMLQPRMTERDHRFVTQHLAGGQSEKSPSDPGASQLN